tara:strand:+ start:3661 stop:4659 length:999 start_codon:yes stop_codon:yes gene_type:complete
MPDGIVRDTVLERLTKIKRGGFSGDAAPPQQPMEPEPEPSVEEGETMSSNETYSVEWYESQLRQIEEEEEKGKRRVERFDRAIRTSIPGVARTHLLSRAEQYRTRHEQNKDLLKKRREYVELLFKIGSCPCKKHKNWNQYGLFSIDEINNMDQWGKTPLMNAADAGASDVVRRLLELGADNMLISRNIGYAAGKTALDIVKWHIERKSHSAFRDGYIDTLEVLVSVHHAPSPEPETEPMVVYATPAPEPEVQVIASAPEAVADTIIPTLDTWITNLDAQDIKPDLEILGVESIEDLKWLDDEDVGVLFEKVFKKMKKIKAKKFMASLKEHLD